MYRANADATMQMGLDGNEIIIQPILIPFFVFKKLKR